MDDSWPGNDQSAMGLYPTILICDNIPRLRNCHCVAVSLELLHIHFLPPVKMEVWLKSCQLFIRDKPYSQKALPNEGGTVHPDALKPGIDVVRRAQPALCLFNYLLSLLKAVQYAVSGAGV